MRKPSQRARRRAAWLPPGGADRGAHRTGPRTPSFPIGAALAYDRAVGGKRRCLRRPNRGRARALSRHYRTPKGRAGAGLAPRLDESAGKRRSTRIKKGAPWLKPVLVQAAWSAMRKKNSYLQAQFLRLKARRGAKKAVIAVAASILTIVYHMLNDGTCYQDLGPEYFARRNPAKVAAKLAARIRNLGFHVEISAAA